MVIKKAVSVLLLGAILAAPTLVVAQTSPGAPQAVDNDDDGGEWGWVGLLGLLGLLGLKRRDQDVTTRRTTTTSPRT